MPFPAPLFIPPVNMNLFVGEGSVTAAITGTVTTASPTEDDVRDGGLTIIITLSGGMWVEAGATFNAVRGDIIAGMDAASSPTNGWNNRVRDVIEDSTVVRTSDTVVTITLPEIANYFIDATETITVTVPEVAISGGQDMTASPTFTITNVTTITLTIGLDVDTNTVLSVDVFQGRPR